MVALDSAKAVEHAYLENLDLMITHTAVQDGLWSDPATWEGGAVPTASDNALIPEGIQVEISGAAEIYNLEIRGTLVFDSRIENNLLVHTIVVKVLGTFIAKTKRWGSITITWMDGEPWDPNRVTLGYISHGKTIIEGDHKLGWTTTQEAQVGDTSVTLADSPVGWKIGDVVNISGTTRRVSPRPNQDELRTISRIRPGGVIEFDEPLQYDHTLPTSVPHTAGVPVANLTRSITFESTNIATPNRGHCMLMHSPDVVVEYAAFVEMGRTDRLQNISATNVNGRYSLHFHRHGPEKRVYATGNVVIGSPGWGYTNHSSNVIMRGNVAINVVGASFTTEAGGLHTEQGAFINNLSSYNPNIKDWYFHNRDIKQTAALFGFMGDGFWFQGKEVDLIGNYSTGAIGTSFTFHGHPLQELDREPLSNQDFLAVSRVPYEAVISGNVSIGSGSGMRIIWGRNSDGSPNANTVSEIQILNATWAGLFLIYVGSASPDIDKGWTFTNIISHRDPDSIIGDNPNPDDDFGVLQNIGFSMNFQSRNLNLNGFISDGWYYGLAVPPSAINTWIDITTTNCTYSLRRHTAENILQNVKRIGPHPRNVVITGLFSTPTRFIDGVINSTFHFSNLDSFLLPDIVTINGVPQSFEGLQGPNDIPFKSNTAMSWIVENYPEYLEKTQNQLWEEFGEAFGGQVLE